MRKPKVIIVGAGAAGMMAAGQSALAGAETLVLEKMRKSGLKLAITGKGRCNLTNIAEIPEFIRHFGPNGRFLRQCFHRFFSAELTQFFESEGLKLATERGGRIFPAQGKAQQVVQLLERWLLRCGARIEHGRTVDRLLFRHGRICGVCCGGREILADAVIIATGGSSYPATGSSGDGYALAQQAGHTIVEVRPALVPLVTAGTLARRMSGLGLRNVGVAMYVDGKKTASAFGELTFSDFGVSGPVILTLSAAVVDLLRQDKQIELSLDLKPALDDQKLDARLIRDFATRGTEPLSSILRGLLPREMIPVCLEMIEVSAELPGQRVTDSQRNKLRLWLKNLRLTVTGYRPLKEAIVTAGGVALNEVNPRSLESLKINGLYFVGEVLDLQADTGGYNLQAAFSTGWLAGLSAATAPLP